jgi:excisionase family DNA binding protein
LTNPAFLIIFAVMNNKSGIEHYYNSEEAARILGVNVSSIKRWTNENKLGCLKTAGGHRKFSFNHLTEFAAESKKANSKISLLPIENESDLQITHNILKGNFHELTDYLLNKALASDRREMQKVINGLYLAQFSVDKIYDDLITPVLHKIGTLWENGKITVTEEHIATQSIKDCIVRLQGITVSTGINRGKALCVNLSTELHDIALKMVDQLLESNGFQVMFSGQITPTLDLEGVFEKYKPERIYVSSTYNSDTNAAAAEMTMISRLCDKYDCKLYIGGRGMASLNIPALSAVYLKSFHDVVKYI